MKRVSFLIAILLVFGASSILPAFAQVDYNKPEQRNPQGDSDVERGYREHQKDYHSAEHQEEVRQRERDARDQADRASKGEVTQPYNVKKSGDTTEDRNR